MKNTLVGTLAVGNIFLFIALFTEVALAQSSARSGQGRLEEAGVSAKGTPTNVAAASSAKLLVSKTAYVSGQDVCGVIRMTNIGWSPAIVVDIADSLEVHFYSNIPSFPLPTGSTPNWFKEADVPIPLPGPIAPFATATINYCFSLCQTKDHPGANSMRNAISVSVANPPGSPRSVVALSNSFPPPILDCQACCLGDGSCVDAVPARCTTAGGLPRGTGTDCATSVCTQACCLSSGTCVDDTVIACQSDGGEARGLGTDCATSGTTCYGACCWAVGCTNEVSQDTCEREFDQGIYLGNDTTCETQLAACPTGACCESFDSCIDFASEQYHVGKARCENDGGTYQGDGTICADRSCAGACCWAIGCTNEVSQDTCEREFDQGIYLGNDTTCETQFSACSTGACCTEGECIDFASEDYHVGQTRCEVEFGGTFFGTGSTCATANTSCRGACCWEVGCNNNVNSEDCENDFNGIYLGNDTTCQSEMAACPTGACCNEESCLGFETLGYGYSPVFCDEIGGSYLGDGAPCTTTSCCISLFGSCTADSECCSGLVCDLGMCNSVASP